MAMLKGEESSSTKKKGERMTIEGEKEIVKKENANRPGRKGYVLAIV